MDTLSISKIEIDNCELIDSKVISLFTDEFVVHIENVKLHFLFVVDEKESAYSDIKKIDQGDTCLYEITIYNLNTGKVQGRFRPLEFGETDNAVYHYSLTGISKDNSEDKIVILNILKELLK